MNRGIRIGRVMGVQIVLDASWIVIAVLVVLSMYAQLGQFDAAGSGALRWIAAGAAALLFFGSVLAHELSHAYVAQRRGIAVRRIRLFIFGGVAEIEKEAARPQDELAITLAGPVSSLVLAGALFGLALVVPDGPGAIGRVLDIMAVINLALGIFNLVPGFPLDGGRVLRAIIWRVTGNYRRATQIASVAGQVVALALVGLGLWLLIGLANAAGIWYVAIGWFLFTAARTAGTVGLLRDSLTGATAGDVMVRVDRLAEPNTPVAEAFDDHILGSPLPAVPVVISGRVRGFISLRAAEEFPRHEWRRLIARDVMTPLTPAHVVGVDTDMTSVLDQMAGTTPVVFVVDQGRVVGVISVTDAAAWADRANRRASVGEEPV